MLLLPLVGGEGADGARITSSAKTASTGTCKRPERVLGVQPLSVLDMVFAAAIDGAWIVAVTMSEPLVMVSVISSALTLSRPLARLVMYVKEAETLAWRATTRQLGYE